MRQEYCQIFKRMAPITSHL